MFYRKTDIEVLCETLISLVDKHDKAIARNGPGAGYPHAKAIEVIMKKIDDDLKKPIVKTKEVIKKEVEKMTEPVRNFTNGKKKLRPAIKVIHGAADDAKPLGTAVTKSTREAIKNIKDNEVHKVGITVESVQNAPEMSQPQKPTLEDAPGLNILKKPTIDPVQIEPEYVAPSVPPKFHSDGTPVQETVEVPSGIVTPNNIDQMTSQLPD